MASTMGLSRIFGKLSLGTVARNIENRFVSTTSATNYLRKKLYMENPMKYWKKMKVEVPWYPKAPPYQSELIDTTKEDEETFAAVAAKINEQIENKKTGRLFAVVHISGKQYKVTDNDLIVIHGYWPPNFGDTIRLEKVLLLGSRDFSLVGRPILNRDLVSVQATVLEKTLSHTKTFFYLRKRKHYRRIQFNRSQHTIVRINSITINKKIDEFEKTEGTSRIF